MSRTPALKAIFGPFFLVYYVTLPETNSSPLKINGLEDEIPFGMARPSGANC